MAERTNIQNVGELVFGQYEEAVAIGGEMSVGDGMRETVLSELGAGREIAYEQTSRPLLKGEEIALSVRRGNSADYLRPFASILQGKYRDAPSISDEKERVTDRKCGVKAVRTAAALHEDSANRLA